ncbi:3535_t:CDS:2, partial [Dentiscutata heterogama]
MDLIPLQINTDNNNNTEQHCKGCDKDRPCSLFIDNNKTFQGNSKERTNQIIEVISDVDEYKW